MTWLLTTLFLLLAQGAAAPPALDDLGGAQPIRSDINLYLEFHHWLLAHTERQERPEGYETTIDGYARAKFSTSNPLVWRFINDTLIAAESLEAISDARDRPSADLPESDAKAAREALTAFVDAWPRFETNDLGDHRRSLQTILARTLRRQFAATEPRLVGTLQAKLRLRPLDAPITVYPVVDAAEIGVWGKTSARYYVVLPVKGRTAWQNIESLLHELTHLLDAGQLRGSSSVLSRVRAKASDEDAARVEEFLHGLVAWTAGDLIRRLVDPQFQPMSNMSAALRAQIDAHRVTYETVWVDYLEGRIGADEVVNLMASALRPPAASAASSRDS